MIQERQHKSDSIDIRKIDRRKPQEFCYIILLTCEYDITKELSNDPSKFVTRYIFPSL